MASFVFDTVAGEEEQEEVVGIKTRSHVVSSVEQIVAVGTQEVAHIVVGGAVLEECIKLGGVGLGAIKVVDLRVFVPIHAHK
jgi:hypothetical protein